MDQLITNRREFLWQMGKLGLAASALPMIGCKTKTSQPTSNIPFVKPTTKDDLVVADGVNYRIVLEEGQKFGKNFTFGANNDYIMSVPYKSDALLWVNHEFPSNFLLKGKGLSIRDEVTQQRKMVGGSLVRIKKTKGGWQPQLTDSINKRIDGTTKIKFSAGTEIAGSKFAEGTLGNCAGGVTPWNTLLTCEENSDTFYGTVKRDKHHKEGLSEYGWEKYFKNAPEHYGWVVEVNPFTGDAKKLISMGRFAHECATVIQTKDGRAVAYSGDDKADECLYKFVASKPGTLEDGTLYVADVKNGKWISLDRKAHKSLQKEFKNQLEIQMYTRRAAALVGGSPLDRPEDIEIDPETGAIIVSLSNNKKKLRPFGSLLRVQEKGDYDSLEFEATTLISGGKDAGFACPDNLTFDDANNLWIATDISSSAIGKFPYSDFGNNGLFVVPMKGGKAGQSIQIASAPFRAELTGIVLSPDRKSLFMSVQHPKGTWPHGVGSAPRSAVVELSGPTMDQILGGKV